MAYHLYIMNKNYSSWSMRSWVLLRAFDIPFEEHLEVMSQARRMPAWKAFSPTGKVPCLHVLDSAKDTADKPLVIWESLAIVEYLSEAHPDKAIWPADPRARAFARCAAAEMHAGFEAMRSQLSMNCGARISLGDTFNERLRAEVARLAELWREGLDRFGGPWLAGRDFGAVDAFYAPMAVRVRTYGVDLADEKARLYAERLLAHPAVAQWIEDGVKEVWRLEMSEKECLAEGRKLLADYRRTE